MATVIPNGPTMSPQEALQLLDRAASMAPLGRADHVQVQTAVQTLAKLVDADKRDDK